MKLKNYVTPSTTVLVICLTTIAIIFGLSTFGSFVDPLCLNKSNVSVKYQVVDGLLKTIVGKYEKNGHVIITDEKSGPLLFGPYLNLAPGQYTVSWVGRVAKDSKPTFQVYSNINNFLQSKTISVGETNEKVKLMKMDFELKTHVSDMEFKILVNTTDKIEVEFILVEILNCKF